MEFFLVFMLGVALAVVGLFVLRPSLFTRSQQDFSYFEVALEEALTELEEKHREMLAEMEQQRAALLELHRQLLAAYNPGKIQSPKIKAVMELAQEGHGPAVIAKRLGMGTGEVSLILDLEKERKALAENS